MSENVTLNASSSTISLKNSGSLHIILGPMFSGKTTQLNSILTKYADTGLKVVKIIHADDIRDVTASDASGTTHNSSYSRLTSKITIIRTKELTNLDISKYHVIGVDEAQFFQDLDVVVKRWVNGLHKDVRIAGLDGDSNRQLFGKIAFLIPEADKIKKKNAQCKYCLEELERINFHGNFENIKGAFTARTIPSEGVQKDVGGADKYSPACRFHHAMYNHQ